MTLTRLEHDRTGTLSAAPRSGVPGLGLLESALHTGHYAGREAARPVPPRCLLLLGSAAPTPVEKIVRRIADAHGRETAVRRVTCRREEAGGDADSQHAVLRRLFGEHGSEWPPPKDVSRAATAEVEAAAAAPLVLIFVDAHWCDAGTLRWLDHLLRRASTGRLTVLLTTSHGELAASGAAFHELVSREYCTVAGVAELLTSDAGSPVSPDFDDLVQHEPHLLRVVQAAAVLRSTDAELVGALAQLPDRQAAKALRTAQASGMLPESMPPAGMPHALDDFLARLPRTERERLRAQAAEILNDAARPAEQVAELLLAQPALDQPWMISLLKEAAAAVRHTRPAAAVRYLSRLHEIDPEAAGIRVDLARALLDIDPVAAREHLEWALPRAKDPLVKARTVVPLRLAALMTHQESDAPRPLDDVLGRLQEASAPGQVTLATRAMRTALTGAGMQDAVSDAAQVLQADQPRGAWARVAAARVLGLADHTTSALGHLARTISDSRRREEPWAECHARSNQAMLLFEGGEVGEAAAQAEASAQIAHRHGWEAQTPLPVITLSMVQLARADTDQAECTLRMLDGRRFEDAVWTHHHHLMAQAMLHCRRENYDEALDLLDECGKSQASAGLDNPVFTTWWVLSTDILTRLGRRRAAAERAELGQHLARRWPTTRSTGLSLLVGGLVARAPKSVELLTESVRVLADSADRPHHTLAELRLGRALLDLGDKKAARVHLHAARTMAAQHDLLFMAGSARATLTTAGGRSPALDRLARDTLSVAERPVAKLAAGGAANREIADELCLSVRTVEYHLTNVYRKLGVTGRADLAVRLRPDDAQAPSGEGGGTAR